MDESISVVIPTFNSARYIAEAIDSVLRQSVAPTEIIVVDDGSTDNVEEICSRYPIVRFMRQEHAGAARARNCGIEAAGGTLIAFLDSDDLWRADKLFIQRQSLQNDSSLTAVFSHIDEFLSPDAFFQDRKVVARQNMVGVSLSTMLTRRSVFERFGLFPEQWKVGEFIAWYQASLELGLKAAVLPEVLAFRRIHETNTTRKRERECSITLTSSRNLWIEGGSVEQLQLSPIEQSALAMALLPPAKALVEWRRFARETDVEELCRFAYELIPSIYRNLISIDESRFAQDAMERSWVIGTSNESLGGSPNGLVNGATSGAPGSALNEVADGASNGAPGSVVSEASSRALNGILKGLARRSWYQNQYFLKELAELLGRLRSAQVRHMLVSSNALAVFYYPDLTMRAMRDFHICVDEDMVPLTRQLLEKRVHQGGFDNTGASAIPDEKRLFIHGSVINNGVPKSQRRFWANALEVDVFNEASLVLSPPDQLIQTLLDKHLIFASSSLWISDVYRVAQRIADVSTVLERIEFFRVAEPIKLAIDRLFNAFPAAQENDVLMQLRASLEVSVWERIEAQIRLMGKVGSLFYRAQRRYYRVVRQ